MDATSLKQHKTMDTLQGDIEYLPEAGCWLWLRTLNSDGYGIVRCGKTMRPVHRIFYEHFVGVIPRDKQCHHICEVPACVNPKHIQLIRIADHTRIHLGASWKRKRERTHCKNGHEYSFENTYLYQSGKRACKSCRNDSYHRNKSASIRSYKVKRA